MGLGKSLNQSPQGGLEKIGYTSSNGPPGNCYEVLNKYLIRHVLRGQNGGSTTSIILICAVLYIKRKASYVNEDEGTSALLWNLKTLRSLVLACNTED